MQRAELNNRGMVVSTKSGQFVCFADEIEIIAKTCGKQSTCWKAEPNTTGSAWVVMLRGCLRGDEGIRLPRILTAGCQQRESSSAEVGPSKGSRRSCDLKRFTHAPNAPYANKTGGPLLHHMLIRPVVLYGHETWAMLEQGLQALGVFELRVLRMIFGGAHKNGVWQRRINHQLAALYGIREVEKLEGY